MDGHAAFAAPLLAPDLPVPMDVPDARRYAVHRNNVTVSLIDALAANFPAVARITGPDFFRAMARAHVRAHPPVSPLLFGYGCDFAAFIAAYPFAQDMPWLPDVARLERLWLDCFHAADAPPLAAEELARIAPGDLADLRFVPHPATRLFRSSWPTVTIFAMNRDGGTPGPVHDVVAQDALLTRPDDEVTVRILPVGAADFFAALLGGDSLGAAANAALAIAADFDVAAALGLLVEGGAFTALTDGVRA